MAEYFMKLMVWFNKLSNGAVTLPRKPAKTRVFTGLPSYVIAGCPLLYQAESHRKQRPLIIWDGLKAYRSKLVRDYLDSTDGHIQIDFLPLYSPDFNPVEYLWAWLKRNALANFAQATSPSCRRLPATSSKVLSIARISLRLVGSKPVCFSVIKYVK
jgi:transposase